MNVLNKVIRCLFKLSLSVARIFLVVIYMIFFAVVTYDHVAPVIYHFGNYKSFSIEFWISQTLFVLIVTLFILHIATKRNVFLYVSIFLYLIYSTQAVVKAYFHPFMFLGEYKSAIFLYTVLAIPLIRCLWAVHKPQTRNS